MILAKGNIEYERLEFNSGNAERTIFVVPTNRKARRMKKEIISNGARTFHIETLGTLTSKLLAEVKPFQPLDDAVGAYLLKKAARSITPEFFTRYDEKGFPKGTLEKIGGVISEYKRKGVTPEKLLQEAEKAELDAGELKKARDIAAIYARYSELCAELNALEIGDVYSELLALSDEEFSKIFRSVFPSVDTVFARHFTEFAPAEIALLDKTAQAAGGVAVEFRYSKKNPALFEALSKTVENLEKSGFRKKDFDEKPEKTLRKHLAENLFAFGETKKSFDVITVFSGKDKFEEVENIAKIVKDLLAENKTEPHKIAVVFNLISDYSPVVRTVFEEFGIPFNLSDRLTLDKSPAVKAILTFLEIKKNNFYYQTLFSAINNGYSRSTVENPYNLQRFAQEYGIISNAETWKRKLDEVLQNAEDERSRERTETARRDFLKIEKLLSRFDEKFTPREFYSEFKKFLSEFAIADALLEMDATKAEENITAVSRLLESFRNILELVTKEKNGEEKKSFAFYYDALLSAAAWARFNVKERSDYGVLITSAEELRGLQFDYVFFGGLNDGVLPVKYAPEIFFAKNFQTKEEEKLAEQRFVFFNVFNAFEKGIFLSYARTSDKTELSRSVFLDDLERAVAIREIDEEYFETRLYSRKETLIRFGENPETFSTEETEKLRRKISAYAKRKNNEASVYNGYLLAARNETVSEFLARFSQRAFSVSQFENYAACPFKYFTERILKIEVLEDPEREIEPLLIGNYLHETLFEFYTQLNEKGIGIEEKEAENLLFSVAEKLFGKFGFDDDVYFYEREKFFGVAGNRKDSILYRFLEEERNNPVYTPKFFEVSFGRKLSDNEKYDKHLSREEPIEINGVKIAGKIDRVDLYENKFAIIDYKSGKPKVSVNGINSGNDLQLPVYLSAAETLLGEGFEPVKMGIYSLKFGEKYFGFKEIKKGKKPLEREDLRKLIDTAENYIEEYHGKMATGNFSPSESETREKDVCQYCQFRSLCRIDEREER